MENQDSNKSANQSQHHTPSDELYGTHQEPQPEDGAGDFGSAARRPGPEGGVGDLAGNESSTTGEETDDSHLNSGDAYGVHNNQGQSSNSDNTDEEM